MSTDLQKYSTENQLHTIRRYAEQRGFTVVRVFEDSGRSGLRMDGREGLQSLMLEVESGTADFEAILVYDVSRWRRFSGTERSALSLLSENARRKTIRIWAENAPFDLKDELKKRGYRWSPGDEGRRKAWYVDVDVDVDEASRDAEIAYLRQSIYQRDVELFEQTLTAFDRFSVRI